MNPTFKQWMQLIGLILIDALTGRLHGDGPTPKRDRSDNRGSEKNRGNWKRFEGRFEENCNTPQRESSFSKTNQRGIENKFNLK